MGVFTSAGVLNGIDRKALGFQFDEQRLVDQDQDGWLEYIPIGAATLQLSPPYITTFPPYVYYDSDLYTLQSTANTTPTYLYYPNTSFAQSGLLPSVSASSWGYAMPYAAAVPSSTTAQLQWVNPRKFQIICAGLDNAYGLMGASVTQPSFTNLPKIFPDGLNFDLSGADLDNCTNFSDRKLGDVVQ